MKHVSRIFTTGADLLPVVNVLRPEFYYGERDSTSLPSNVKYWNHKFIVQEVATQSEARNVAPSEVC